MTKRQPHRGTEGDRAAFAKKFVNDRLAGFKKDIQICLTPIPSLTRPGPTHAYFPALSACCGLLEYLTVLYLGNIDFHGWSNVLVWTQRYMPQSDYDDDRIRILFAHFRNSVAHRGIASGVWIDRKRGPGYGRRLTWKVHADAHRPPIEIVAEDKQLKNDPPWPCPYTHRVYIHLKSLAADIRKGAIEYANDVSADQDMQDRFFACMHKLYP